MSKQNEVLIKKPKRNTFRSRPKITFTGNIGELIPAHWQLLLPTDRIEVQSDCVVKFPPLTTPAFARMNVVTETFFVPLSQISNNFMDMVMNIKKESSVIVENGEKLSVNIQHDGYFTIQELNHYMDEYVFPNQYNIQDPFEQNSYSVINQKESVSRLVNAIGVPAPYCFNPYTMFESQLSISSDVVNFCKSHGFSIPKVVSSAEDNTFITSGWLRTILSESLAKVWLDPFRAYQHIYNEFYRDSSLHSKVDLYPDLIRVPSNNPSSADSFRRVFNSLCQMRYRCYRKDIFNTSSTDPTLGAQAIAVPSNVLDLRKANVFERLMEKRAMCGSRVADYLLQHFGTVGNSYELDRPLLLSRSVSPVQISETLQTSETTSDSVQGTRSGNANAYQARKGFYFSAPDYGIVMTIVSVVPDIAYIGGLSRKLNIQDWESIPLPELSSIGMQSIRSSELSIGLLNSNATDTATFGYEERYAEYKYENDRVFGEFETNLNSWHQYPSMVDFYGPSPAMLNTRFPVVGFRDPNNWPTSLSEVLTPQRNNFVNRIFNVLDDSVSDHCLFSLVMQIQKNTTLSTNAIMDS